jgi:hypothetical protein
MTDRPLDKYLSRNSSDRDGGHTDSRITEEDATDDLGCFGWLRGVRDRAVMLELRKKDGTIAAFSYAYLERADFDPSEGITLYVMGRTIRIKGRNLNGEARPQVRLFGGITRHRVPWIQECRAEGSARADDAPVVDSVTC